MYRGECLDPIKQEANTESYVMIDITYGTHETNNARNILFGKHHGEWDYTSEAERLIK
jgi:hypothetical protein